LNAGIHGNFAHIFHGDSRKSKTPPTGPAIKITPQILPVTRVIKQANSSLSREA
jgi:hypothetical protein